jgi:hypothetical protein
MSLGYFEAHRLWDIFDELKARDLRHQTLIIDLPHADKEYRDSIKEWLDSRQSRMNPEKEQMPQEAIDLLNQMKKEIELGRRRQ